MLTIWANVGIICVGVYLRSFDTTTRNIICFCFFPRYVRAFSPFSLWQKTLKKYEMCENLTYSQQLAVFEATVRYDGRLVRDKRSTGLRLSQQKPSTSSTSAPCNLPNSGPWNLLSDCYYVDLFSSNGEQNVNKEKIKVYKKKQVGNRSTKLGTKWH